MKALESVEVNKHIVNAFSLDNQKVTKDQAGRSNHVTISIKVGVILREWPDTQQTQKTKFVPTKYLF